MPNTLYASFDIPEIGKTTFPIYFNTSLYNKAVSSSSSLVIQSNMLDDFKSKIISDESLALPQFSFDDYSIFITNPAILGKFDLNEQFNRYITELNFSLSNYINESSSYILDEGGYTFRYENNLTSSQVVYGSIAIKYPGVEKSTYNYITYEKVTNTNFNDGKGYTEIESNIAFLLPEDSYRDGKFVNGSLNNNYPLVRINIRYHIPMASSRAAFLYRFMYDRTNHFNISQLLNYLNGDDVKISDKAPGPGPEPEPEDPYKPGGTSSGGGGQGSFDSSGDDVSIPALPTLSALSTGFISLFTPTIAELNNLANYMWNDDLFSLDTWKKIFANPMDAILGLSIVPVAVPSAGQVPVTVGNISTGVSMTKAAAQYVTLDCGSVTIPEYWGAYLDYDPYTKIELYLPYIGIVPVKADDIIGRAIHIAYHVDILSGACCAMVQCGNSILYTYNGSCAMQIPVSGVDMTTAISSVISASASVAAMLASGGAGTLLGGAITAGAITNTANSVMNAKPTVQHSGSMTGPGGQLGVQTPYFIVTRPRQCVAENQNNLVGLPAFFTVNLGDLSGYAEVEDIHLQGIPATSDELDEIAQLLKNGVIY